MMKRIFYALAWVLFAGAALFAQNQIRLMNYNLLNYDADTTRNAFFRTVVQANDPDIVVVQEVLSVAGKNNFLNNVLNHGGSQYQAGAFILDSISSNALYYKPSKFIFVSNSAIPASPRDLNEFTLVYFPTLTTFRIYALHLKAEQGPANELQRLAQVQALRQVTNALPPGSDFIVCGDFNIYTAAESAYAALLNPAGPGYVLDPLPAGNWHANPSFAAIHTQSTRVRAFGNGATGGLDDRFDMILLSQAVSNPGGMAYVTGSYTAFGNDGFHFNDSINALPNLAVPPEVANALHYASDHLPVLAGFQFGGAPPLLKRKLLLTEIVVTPTAGEFIEIYNPNNEAVELGNYYLTDATFAANGSYYYKIVTGGSAGGGSNFDFHARFPEGASIQPGEYQTVAIAGDLNFYNSYGVMPTYELYEDGNSFPQDAPNMREALPGSINNQGTLTNDDEVVILYYWDGVSDLVDDVDYLIYDDAGLPPNEAVDKTGVSIDGPDPGTTPSTYLNDTPIASQLPAPTAGIGFSTHRIDFSEGNQTVSGGNGVSGGDETSENLNATFTSASLPSPNAPWNPPGGGTVNIPVQLNGGWNLAGLPCNPANRYYLSLFPTATPGTLFGFNGAYVSQDSLEAGRGYWLRFPASTTATLSGTALNFLPLPLAEGWNLISGLTCPAALSAVGDPGNLIIAGTLFGFDGAYVAADTLKPGRAYWLRARNSGQVTLACAAPSLHAAAKSPQALSLAEWPGELPEFARVVIIDAAGAQQTLYFRQTPGGAQLPRESFSLPPLSPAGSFDARFRGDYRLAEGEEAEILLQASQYPLTVRFARPAGGVGEGFLLDELAGGNLQRVHAVAPGSEVLIENPQVDALRLHKNGVTVPGEFRVEQNFPNPFNPVTEIRYTLPRAAPVEVAVYDALGRRIKILVSGPQEAGMQRVIWDATDGAGEAVSSGVYFYRVKAGEYQAARKMLLLH